MSELAQTMHELEAERDALKTDEDKLRILFLEMVQICLWGNATVCSLLLASPLRVCPRRVWRVARWRA